MRNKKHCVPLNGALGTFQGAINATLALGLHKFVIVFFDDILVYSRSFEDHLCHLAAVFRWLHTDSWKNKLSKYKFTQRFVAHLGHIINEQGLSTDPSKIHAIENWPVS